MTIKIKYELQESRFMLKRMNSKSKEIMFFSLSWSIGNSIDYFACENNKFSWGSRIMRE